jgi:hypothetical protein
MLDLSLLNYFSAVQSATTTVSSKKPAAPKSKTKPAEITDQKTNVIFKNVINSVFESFGNTFRDFGENAPGGGAVLIIIPQY